VPYGWRPYVPVAKRREQAMRKMNKLKKKGMDIQPIQIEKRKIAHTFWGKAWCDHIESFSDYDNRLPRGRTYVRNGSVCHLAIENGIVKGIVSGSKLYNVNISIEPLPKAQWQTIKSKCVGQIGSLLELLSGQLADTVMNVVCHPEQGLFPLTKEIKLSCDCPDWAVMCKHVAAALYGVASRLDHSPEQLFLLRGVNHEELVDISSVVSQAVGDGKAKRRRIADSSLSQVFDIDLSDSQSDGNHSKSDADNSTSTQTDVKNADAQQEGISKRKARIQTVSKAASGQTERQKSHVGKKKHSKARVSDTIVSSSKKIKPQRKSASKQSSFPKYISGYALRKKRVSLNLTQAELAIFFNVSASTISQWERKGRKKLNLKQQVLDVLHRIWNDS